MTQVEEKEPVKMSESLIKFIEQDNKMYLEELKKAGDQKQFNSTFFKELQKTMVMTAAQMEEQAKQDKLMQELQKRQYGYGNGDFFGGPSSGAGGFFGGGGGNSGGGGGFIS